MGEGERGERGRGWDGRGLLKLFVMLVRDQRGPYRTTQDFCPPHNSTQNREH